MVRSRVKKVNRSRSPRLNDAHPQTTADYVSLTTWFLKHFYSYTTYMTRNSTYVYNCTSGGLRHAPAQWGEERAQCVLLSKVKDLKTKGPS